jgi:hypothetical protein
VQHKDGLIFPVEITLGEFQCGSRRIFTGVLRAVQRNVPAPVIGITSVTPAPLLMS